MLAVCNLYSANVFIYNTLIYHGGTSFSKHQNSETYPKTMIMLPNDWQINTLNLHFELLIKIHLSLSFMAY